MRRGNVLAVKVCRATRQKGPFFDFLLRDHESICKTFVSLGCVSRQINFPLAISGISFSCSHEGHLVGKFKSRSRTRLLQFVSHAETLFHLPQGALFIAIHSVRLFLSVLLPRRHTMAANSSRRFCGANNKYTISRELINWHNRR